VRHVNVSNTIIVNNINVTNVYGRRAPLPRYTYSSSGNAVTTVQRDVLVNGRPVAGHRVQLNDRDLRQWRTNVRPASIAPERQSILAGQPRRQAPPPAAFANDNGKRVGADYNDNGKRVGADYRATRVAAEEIKRAQNVQRNNIAPESRIALRDPERPTQPTQARSTTRDQNDRPSREQNETPRSRDHMQRPPVVQSLQSSPSTEGRSNFGGSNELRRPRQTQDDRDTFQRSNDNRREQPPVRQYSQPESRQPAPVERRAAPPVVREQPREQPRVERSYSEPREIRSSPPPQRQQQSSPAPRQNNNQNNNQNSNSSSSRRSNNSPSADSPGNWHGRSNR
jgi:hypothetical protein